VEERAEDDVGERMHIRSIVYRVSYFEASDQ
jgi:hypothetical protein